MTTTQTISRERLEEIINDPMINQGSEFAHMARMLLAAMDSEPVYFRKTGSGCNGFGASYTDWRECTEEDFLNSPQGKGLKLYAAPPAPVEKFGIGSVFKPRLLVEPEVDCDNCAHYQPETCHGEGCTAKSAQSCNQSTSALRESLQHQASGNRPAVWVRLGDNNHAPDCTLDHDEAREWESRGLEVLRMVAPAPVAVPDEWRSVLQEMVNAMLAYEMDVGEPAPYKHRKMMMRAGHLLESHRGAMQAEPVTAATVPDGAREALSEAVAAIYFTDSSDYLLALFAVVKALSPETLELLLSNAKAAYDATRIAAAPAAPEQEV